MKLYQYINLQEVYNEIKNMKLPFKTSYNFTKLLKIAEEKNAFYQTELQKIIAEYGDMTQVEEDRVKIKTGNEKVVEEKINELLSIDIEDPEVVFTVEELEGLNLTISQMNSLMPFIKE